MKENKEHKSALNVQEGIAQPPSLNPAFKKRARKQLSKQEYIDGILAGDRVIMSMAITLIESSLPEHYALAQEIIDACMPYSGNSVRLGITGVPGAGKSTFVESFGKLVTSKGHKLAVLAIDPSSERTKGSILGDKTRMEALSVDPNAFIRPSPSAGSLGGVARKTRESIIICEAAGVDWIIVETVGVGQSEISVHSMVDFFLLLMLAGAGDELQGIKRGIMEMADLLVINKADGDNVQNAIRAKSQYTSAMRLFPPTSSGWKPYAETCSALYHEGMENIWEIINEYVKLTKDNSYFENNRNKQMVYILDDFVNRYINQLFYTPQPMKSLLEELRKELLENKISPYKAGQMLLEAWLSNIKEENISLNFEE